MPNGNERNWGRLCHAIDGFRAVHHAWPTRVRLSEVSLANLRDDLFTPETFSKLKAKLEFVAEDAQFIVEDDSGHRFSYEEQLSAMHTPDIRAESWLGVTIDRPQDDPWEHLR